MRENKKLLEIFDTKEEKTLLSLISDGVKGDSIHSTIIAVDNDTTDNNLLDTIEACIGDSVVNLFKYEKHILLKTYSDHNMFLMPVSMVSANEMANVLEHSVSLKLT